MAFCGQHNVGYATCLKNAVNVLVSQVYKMNF